MTMMMARALQGMVIGDEDVIEMKIRYSQVVQNPLLLDFETINCNDLKTSNVWLVPHEHNLSSDNTLEQPVIVQSSSEITFHFHL
jgi:hypothetical protein